MLQLASQLFWNEQIWLGSANRTWEQYENAGYRRFNDIYYSIFTGIAILWIRFLLESYIFTPLGLWFGIEPKKTPPLPLSPVLEKTFLKFSGKIPKKKVDGLAKQLDLTIREIERWLRLRRLQDRPTLVSKFADSACKFTSYTFLFVFGLFAMWDKPCLWDTQYCLWGYPNHMVFDEIWWYHNIEIGVYISFLISQFKDVKRKDFWTMFIHHVVTLSLFVVSWAINFTLVGSLTVLIHDISDIPLEMAKCLTYLKKIHYGKICFTIFAISWVITRLVIFPYRIVYYTVYEGLYILPDFPAYYIMNTFIILLQLLHFIWTYFIIKVAVNLWKNQQLKDSRSDDEDDIEDDDSM